MCVSITICMYLSTMSFKYRPVHKRFCRADCLWSTPPDESGIDKQEMDTFTSAIKSKNAESQMKALNELIEGVQSGKLPAESIGRMRILYNVTRATLPNVSTPTHPARHKKLINLTNMYPLLLLLTGSAPSPLPHSVAPLFE